MSVNTVGGSQYIRCFDLGGSGLKTALFKYDSHDRKITMITTSSLLGKCSDGQEVHSWMRETIKANQLGNIDREIDKGYLFGLSLADLGNRLRKLQEKGVKTMNISELFQFPADRTGYISDGSAHLLASIQKIKKLPEGRVWNFSIGTSVGISFIDRDLKTKSEDEIKAYFGQDPWTVQEPTTQEPIWKAGSAKAFCTILEKSDKQIDASISKFAERWQGFIQKKIIESPNNSLGKPAAIVFTGGHTEHQEGRLVKKLNESSLQVPVFEGPKHAGLYGAAWQVLKTVGLVGQAT